MTLSSAEPVSLASVNAGTFRALLHASFSITLPGREPTLGTLTEIAERPASLPEGRAPFSLVFCVPRAASPTRGTQGTVRIEHKAVGILEVFAVALQPTGDVAPWQVVFG